MSKILLISLLDFIAAIDQKLIKSQRAIEEFTSYITRKHQNILCYALRKGLELHNSSNPVEKHHKVTMFAVANGMRY